MNKLCFLTNSSELDKHFVRLASFFERVVSKATHGEFEVKDLYRLARQDYIVIGMIEQHENIQLAFAFEFIAYPCFTAINVLAFAGHGVTEAFTLFGARFKAWCRETGT